MSDETTDTTESTTPEPEPTVPIELDGVEVDARPGELVIAAAERLGVFIPRFCYHPRMSSVGKCRQCLVQIDTGRGMAIQPSCMITVSPGMKVDTQSDIVKRAQEGVLELFLINHPLDCPVCDKGGECPLQDQTMSHGPGESRYVEAKRTFDKPLVISDHILLDRERCILCDRCTRFADEVAGDKLIHFVQRGNQTQINTFPNEPFASYFSGNVAQICPVGALTAKPYRFKARPWDLEQVDSTCTTCSVGCRVSVHSSRDQLLRVQGLDADSVNHGWLCDRGRFNFQATDSEHRLTDPLVRGEAGQTPVNWNTAISLAAKVLSDADRIGMLGGARSTNEGAFAWAKLADALGVEYRDAQIGDGLPAELLGYPRATINEAHAAATVVLMSPDLKEELPVLYLRIRDAAVHGSTKLIEFSQHDTGISRYAWRSIRYTPGGLAAAVAQTFGAEDVAAQLAAGPVVIIAGRPNLAESAAVTMAAIDAALAAVPGATVLPALRRGNVVGALQLGMAPADPDHDALATLAEAAAGRLDVLVLVGSDPLHDCPDADLARRALAGARRVISVDAFATESTRHADIVLPVTVFGEHSGSTTNLEGRVSLVTRKVTAAGSSRPDWMIVDALADALGHDLAFEDVDGITDRIAAEVPGYGAATAERIRSDREGVVAIGTFAAPSASSASAPAPSGYDYRVVVDRTMYDDATMTSMSPSLVGLIPVATARLHPADLARLGVDDGTPVNLISASGSVVLPVTADGRVQRGTVWAPFRHKDGSIGSVVDSSGAVTDVRIERLS